MARDRRTLLGIPNAGNVLTNAFFLLAGVIGLGFVLGGKTRNAFLAAAAACLLVIPMLAMRSAVPAAVV